MRQCAEYAEKSNIRYSLEPHPFRYGSNSDGMLRRLTRWARLLWVSLLPKPYLAPSGEIPHTTVYRLNKRIFHCDFSDINGMTNVTGAGKGKMDWKRVFVALKAVLRRCGIARVQMSRLSQLVPRNVPGVYRGNTIATPELDTEYTLALEYLSGLAKGAGFDVE